MNLSVPAKTFILGEYAILHQGSALLLTTQPRFELQIRYTAQPTKTNNAAFHPSSPAGKWLANHHEFYRSYQLTFYDAYTNFGGGLGASSAQFLLSYALMKHQLKQKIHHQQLITDYLNCSWDGVGYQPSGADLIAQWQGQICHYDAAHLTITTQTWPFQQLNYAILHTNAKLPTHDHLRAKPVFDSASLKKIAAGGIQAFNQREQTKFIEAINQYARCLANAKLTAPHTQALLQHLKVNKKILAAKGCGALGADVIFILYARRHKSAINAHLASLPVRIITHGQAATPGLQCEIIQQTKISDVRHLQRMGHIA